MKILVVEDNESVCSMIEMFFLKEGWEGAFATDGKEGWALFESNPTGYDFILLDWMLPGMDGITLCRKIRGVTKNVPVIMLTAKDSDSDQVLGLEMGADDYVTKPFSPLTLMARIKAVRRRYEEIQPKGASLHYKESTYFKISKETREIFYQDTAIDGLTPKEFDLLYYFIHHPKQVFTREQLLDRIWGYEYYGDERTVDVHIKRLRKKIRTATHPFIHTVWGVGYKFDETVVEE
ncbi:LuxR family transcriptional regulator [Bacillus coahuilensis m2-6]|uniref:LuxR family transcriptional regulator n=1 Tax=Bacillus coahuilensis p1.1.43 TaxID=1150625 RepID=A0A147KAP8_9BACI|nr:response regulator transcription factor [Bacillus coahuilensis]KUP07861.1 LuxR family transcriptional regulator [Bacillus coahuilensis p1.1.43]KUP09506.1 LuxR family transcriptional regulator [Bacillus coahuilensis m2-6]